MEFFGALDLISIPREHNSLADKLAISASTFQPSEELLIGQGKMEVISRPSIPDNMDHWQVFNGDKQILIFMNNLQEFSGFKVGYKEEGHEYKEEEKHFENPTPKGLIKLEQIFDMHDRHKNKERIKPGDYIEVNIGTTEDPKIIKGTLEELKKKKIIINLVHEYRDVFAFTYDELKSYREDVIQHTIPLKEDTKPFR
jgi:hypothetical protein